MSGMIGWDGGMTHGQRPRGVHPLASVGGHPENRNWMVGDPSLAPQIASSALVHAFCTIDAGVEHATSVGERSFLQARVHMGHDSVIGDDCEICAGVVLCGHVVIGNNVRVGGNTWIKPRVTIGDGAIIGGGSVVTKDIPAHEVWCGSPARFLKVAWTHPSLNELEQRQRAAAFPSTADILEYVGARSPHDMRQRMFQRETGQPPILAEYIYE